MTLPVWTKEGGVGSSEPERIRVLGGGWSAALNAAEMAGRVKKNRNVALGAGLCGVTADPGEGCVGSTVGAGARQEWSEE